MIIHRIAKKISMELKTVQQIAAIAQAKKPAFSVPWRPALMKYAELYKLASAGCEMADPCMLAAIVARESGGQNILQHGVSPGPRCGVGLCQITYGVSWANISQPSYPGYGDLFDPLVNLKVAAHCFLEPALERFPGNHRAAFDAYNLGLSSVAQEIADAISPDAWTTDNDYGISVLTDWINFSAASMGLAVEWSSYTG